MLVYPENGVPTHLKYALLGQYCKYFGDACLKHSQQVIYYKHQIVFCLLVVIVLSEVSL